MARQVQWLALLTVCHQEAAARQVFTKTLLEMPQFADEVRVACADVDMTVLQETCGRLEQEVLIPVKGWLQHARSLQGKATAFQDKKAIYDHYSRKVAALRETHEKRASTGRSEKTKETERIHRNEQKLAAVTQEYTRLSDTVIRDLRAFVMSRDAALAPLLRRVLQGRVVYAERMHEATGRIRALIEDGVEESEDGGVLGQFMTVVQGGGHVGSEAIMAAATSSLPTRSVRKSSFEAFVGEAPPHASTHHTTHKSGADDDWMAFASSLASPLANETQAPSPTSGDYSLAQSHYTPPLGVPQFMTVNVPSNTVMSKSWGEDVSAPIFPTMPANVSLPSSMASCPSRPPIPTTTSWDVFPTASAPSVDPFPSGEGSTTASSQLSPWTPQQQQVPTAEFRDMHMSALSGEASFF